MSCCSSAAFKRTWRGLRLHDAQHGFHPNRGKADCLFSMRWLVELARSHATPLHVVFVDFHKAFDSVNHKVMWRILKARGFHPKLSKVGGMIFGGSNNTNSRLFTEGVGGL